MNKNKSSNQFCFECTKAFNAKNQGSKVSFSNWVCSNECYKKVVADLKIDSSKCKVEPNYQYSSKYES